MRSDLPNEGTCLDATSTPNGEQGARASDPASARLRDRPCPCGRGAGASTECDRCTHRRHRLRSALRGHHEVPTPGTGRGLERAAGQQAPRAGAGRPAGREPGLRYQQGPVQEAVRRLHQWQGEGRWHLQGSPGRETGGTQCALPHEHHSDQDVPHDRRQEDPDSAGQLWPHRQRGRTP